VSDEVFRTGGRFSKRGKAKPKTRGSHASKERTAMAKVIEWNQAAPTCSIPLKLAVYCVNCNTIPKSRPRECAICGSQAVLRVPILGPDPEPPAAQRRLSNLPTHMPSARRLTPVRPPNSNHFQCEGIVMRIYARRCRGISPSLCGI
jgi:hypothetical protein